MFVVDALLWSSGWVALAAVALTGAVASALGAPAAPAILVLAFAGTVVVYTVDRLRDLERDRLTAPVRTAFVARHGTALRAGVGAAGIAAAVCVIASGPRVAALISVVGALGLFHRRLKDTAWAKPLYLTFAWTAVAVGLPTLQRGASAPTSDLVWVAAIVWVTVQANVALSNLRDDEAIAARFGRARTLAFAAACTFAAAGAALVGPPAVRPLLTLPAAMLPALAFFRPSERYGAGVVDGALVVGGAIAWLVASGR